MTAEPAAFVVHCLDHCAAVLDAARRTGRTVILWSPPEAAASLGIGYFTAMLAAARRQVPGVPAEAVLDCGDAPGLALAALDAGLPAVRLAAASETLRRLDDIAAQRGARVERRRPAGCCDLADSKAPLADALVHLSG